LFVLDLFLIEEGSDWSLNLFYFFQIFWASFFMGYLIEGRMRWKFRSFHFFGFFLKMGNWGQLPSWWLQLCYEKLRSTFVNEWPFWICNMIGFCKKYLCNAGNYSRGIISCQWHSSTETLWHTETSN
jgi:hypothetical protein